MSLVAGSGTGTGADSDSDCDSDAMFTLSTCVVCPLPYSVLRHSTAAGAETEAGMGVAGGTAAAFNVRSWQWNNIKLCLYICNAAAASTSSLPPAACAARAP